MECQKCHCSDEGLGLALVKIIFPPFTERDPFSWLFCINCCEKIMTFVSKDDLSPEDIIKIITDKYEGEKLNNDYYIK